MIVFGVVDEVSLELFLLFIVDLIFICIFIFYIIFILEEFIFFLFFLVILIDVGFVKVFIVEGVFKIWFNFVGGYFMVGKVESGIEFV